MVHLVAKYPESLPVVCSNTYVQRLGLKLGQYGANVQTEPEYMDFDETAEDKIGNILGDKNARIYFIEE